MEKVKEEICRNNNTTFIQALFLVCPLCGENTYIESMIDNGFTTKCGCTKWKITYEIEEI